ncbi:hypothetical protein F5B21DRAFT_498221 [Xylaria acuta]|nr:hypothetical protein F5B21DRAFT_498221 [Xylaria acuta]
MSSGNSRRSSVSPSLQNRHPCPQPHPQSSVLPSDHPLGRPPKSRHIRSVNSIHKYWAVFPWEVIAADQQPATWSDNLLDKLVKLSRRAPLPWAHEQLQRTIAQGKTLAPLDVDKACHRAAEEDPQTRLPRAPPNPRVTMAVTATASREHRRSGPVVNPAPAAPVGSTAMPYIPPTPPSHPRDQRSMATSEPAALGADTDGNSANDNSERLTSPQRRSLSPRPLSMSATLNSQDTSNAPVLFRGSVLETNKTNYELGTDGAMSLHQPSPYRRGAKRIRLSTGTSYPPSVLAPVLTAPKHLPFNVEDGSKEVLAHFLSTPGVLCHVLNSKCARLDETRNRAQDRLNKEVEKLQALESKRASLQQEISSQEAEIADKEKNYEIFLQAEKQFADAAKQYLLARRGVGIVNVCAAATAGDSGESSQARKLIDDLQTKLQEKKKELEDNSSSCEQVYREIGIARTEADETTKEWETACDEYGKWCELLNSTFQVVSDVFGLSSILAGPNDDAYGVRGRTITLASADQLQFTETTPTRRSRSTGGRSAGP